MKETNTYEAYLGPTHADTLATGEGPLLARYAVVREDRNSGEITWIGAYEQYSAAVASAARQTTQYAFGILCRVRLAK